jgi:hypothetical protein
MVLPAQLMKSAADTGSALEFLGLEIHGRIAFFYLAKPFNGAGFVKHGLSQRCFAGAPMTNKCYVSDTFHLFAHLDTSFLGFYNE